MHSIHYKIYFISPPILDLAEETNNEEIIAIIGAYSDSNKRENNYLTIMED